MSKPIIGISTCHEKQGLHYYHQTSEKYISAILDVFDAVPFLIPSMGDRLDLDTLLDNVDGFLFTGSYSNIEPKNYSDQPNENGTKHDAKRDATTLPLIPKAIHAGIPVLAICRGFQEMNVAFGGTLHQKVHEIDGLNDHREDDSLDLQGQYDFSHSLNLVEGGILASISSEPNPHVNSVHWQGVATLGDGLEIEATSPDGLVEAFRVKNAKSFALAVQWHPEYNVSNIPFYKAIFQQFGQAVNTFRGNK